MKTLILSLIFSVNIFAFYGVDNRMEYFEIKEEKLKKAAKAVAFQTYRDDSSGWDFNRFWTLKSSPLSKLGVCASEPYANQPAFSRSTCASVLIAPNLLLTAGNCLSDHYCNNGLFYWMFNYDLEENIPFSLKKPRKDFYKCKRIVKRVYDTGSFLSYSIIELKNKVEGIEPIKISQKDLSVGDELVVLGFPSGLPLKVAYDTQVIRSSKNHILVNSDIGGNNKGTLLLDAKTMQLAGILIDGRKDYTQGPGGCDVSEKLDKEDAVELGLKVLAIKELFEL